jgi:hypothetical protein
VLSTRHIVLKRIMNPSFLFRAFGKVSKFAVTVDWR